jgi:hypothetical protein
MAKRYDLRLDKGASCSLEIEPQDADGSALDLTGFTASAQIRQNHKSEIPLAVFIVSITGGVIALSLGAAQTAAIDKREGVWDCLLRAPDGTAVRLVEGKAFMTPEVTR